MENEDHGNGTTTIYLHGFDPSNGKIPAIKFVKSVYALANDGENLGLKGAKDAVDSWGPNDRRQITIPTNTVPVIMGYAQAVGIRAYAAPDYGIPYITGD